MKNTKPNSKIGSDVYNAIMALEVVNFETVEYAIGSALYNNSLDFESGEDYVKHAAIELKIKEEDVNRYIKIYLNKLHYGYTA